MLLLRKGNYSLEREAEELGEERRGGGERGEKIMSYGEPEGSMRYIILGEERGEKREKEG